MTKERFMDPALGPVEPAGGPAAANGPATSLFDRVGGEEGLVAAVEEFYARVLTDPDLVGFFERVNMDWLREQQVRFFAQVLGGPAEYDGASMPEAHARLEIQPRHFERVAQHLRDALTAVGAAPSDTGAILTLVGSLRDEIVNTPPDRNGNGRGAEAPSASGSRLRTGARSRALARPAQHVEAFDLEGLSRTTLDHLQTNVFVADTALRLVYMNPRARRTLERFADEIQRAFGVRVEEIEGGSIHRFHRDARRVEAVLRDPRRLPHEAEFNFGEITLRTAINAIRDGAGTIRGYVVNWEDVTERLRLESEMARVMSMMESSPTNVMYADRELVIRYINPASLATLRRLEQHLPVRADQVVGTSIDRFHRDPATQRRILSDPRNLPHQVDIPLGPEVLNLLVSAIHDQHREYIGAMVTWEIVTAKVAAERQAKELAASIADNSRQLTDASEGLKGISREMAGNAEETATQANVVSAASEQVSASVQTVAASAEEMGASIKEIAKSANEAARVASSAVDVARSTNRTVSRLGESSQEIGKVVDVITSIAQQTKLLALNATIEAARAGEAGKGFAVVANEVKELAKETAEATGEIRQRIEAIQGDTRGAVDAIAEFGQIVERINSLQNTIAGAVEEQTATTSEIVRNVNEAARGSSEIAKNIGGVADAARNTTRGANDTQSAADALAKLSEALMNLVKRLE